MLKTRPSHQLRLLALFMLSLVFLSLGLTACTEDQFIADSYKTLKISADTYDHTMQIAGDLHGQGSIDDATKDKIVDFGLKFQLAHRAASIALDAYATAVQDKNQNLLDTRKNTLLLAIAEASKHLGEMVDLVQSYRQRTASLYPDDAAGLVVPATSA